MASKRAILCVDVGGTRVKAGAFDQRGVARSNRHELGTPRPATPVAIERAIVNLAKSVQGELGDRALDACSIGFPGVVRSNIVYSAPNLDGPWTRVRLGEKVATKLGVPVRMRNDAGVQGAGLISGAGVELVLTFGTGLGCALYTDGTYAPNIELGHHVFRGKTTYEEFVCDKSLKRIGAIAWGKRVKEILPPILALFNPDRLYLGGGNARLFEKQDFKLAYPVTIGSNDAGLSGGVKLW